MISLDRSLLEAALLGFQARLRTLDENIGLLRSQLGGEGSKVAVAADGATPKRQMSAGAKARIAAAQKKRWAAYHKEHSEAAKPAPTKATRKKRVLSPAAKKHIADATRKRWAVYRAQKTAAAKAVVQKNAARKAVKKVKMTRKRSSGATAAPAASQTEKTATS